MLLFFLGGQSQNGTCFKQVCMNQHCGASFERQKQAEGNRRWKSIHPTPASIPHNYTGPQIERQFSFLPDPLLFSFLCHSAALCRDSQSTRMGRGYLDVRIYQKREHWSDDRRITFKGLKGWMSNFARAEVEWGGKAQCVCLCTLESIFFSDEQEENNWKINVWILRLGCTTQTYTHPSRCDVTAAVV